MRVETMEKTECTKKQDWLESFVWSLHVLPIFMSKYMQIGIRVIGASKMTGVNMEVKGCLSLYVDTGDRVDPPLVQCQQSVV